MSRFRIVQKIGEGGHGVVYVAEQMEPVRRLVALKVLKLGMDTLAVVGRFEAERQTLARMDHPNIAKVLDAGVTEQGRPFFVMEMVRGDRITDFCDRNRLSTRDRLRLFIKVCQAVQHAHQKGIIHRDIKPSNILVEMHDGTPVPKVIDFGIAKAIDPLGSDGRIETQVHQFLGTPAYASPEQVAPAGLDIDTRSDIYSLGALLYELLTGKAPTESQEWEDAESRWRQRTWLEKEPVRPSVRLSMLKIEERAETAKQHSMSGGQLLQEVNGDLDWIVMKCLEQDRARRYETVNGLAADLARYLAHEPVSARPPSPGYRFRKFLRRHRTLAAAVTGVVLAMLLGTGISLWQAVRATRANRAELAARQLAEQSARQADRERALAEAARRDAVEHEWAMRRRTYASDMVLAQQAVEARNLARARGLLERWEVAVTASTPEGSESTGGSYPDLRGWEWRYLWSRTQPEPIVTLPEAWQNIRSLSLSPDARWLALADNAGAVCLWNLAEQRKVWSLHVGDPNSRVSIGPDGHTLAYVTLDRAAPGAADTRLLWVVDLDTRAVRQRIPIPGECRGMGFSGDGREVIALVNGGDDGHRVQVWDVAEGSKLASHAVTHGWSMGLAFDLAVTVPLVVHGTDKGEARVLNWKTGEELLRVAVRGPWVSSLAISPDGRLVAASGSYNDSSVHLYEIATGKKIRILDGHRDWIPTMRFTVDGRALVTGSTDSTVRIWDLEREEQSRTFVASDDEVTQLAVGSILVSGSRDGKVQVWRDYSRTQSGADSVVLPGAYWIGGFQNTSGDLVTLAHDGAVSRWKRPQFQEAVPLSRVPAPNFWGSCQSSDGQWLAALSKGRAFVVSTHEARPPVALQADPRSTMVLGFAENNERVLLGRMGDSWMQVLDRASGREVRRVELPGVIGMSTDLTSDGQEVVLYEPTSFFDWSRGSRREFGAGATYGGSFSPSGRFFAFASLDGSVAVWEVHGARRVGLYRSTVRSFHSAAFSPDDRRVVGGNHGAESIVLWDRETGYQLLSLSAVGVVIERVCFSPDGNSILALSRDQRLQIWSAPSWDEIASMRKRL